jgi:hypothetical protein
MGLRVFPVSRPTAMSSGFSLLLFSILAGCQVAPSVSVNRLVAYQAAIDLSGLKPPQAVEPLNVAVSIPNRWEALRFQKRLVYVNQQWRSPSRNTGIGVAYIHMPLPVSAKMIIWFAKMQYASQSRSDGKPMGMLLGQWTDSIGREWFEAQDNKYHVKGYAITNGFDAWIIYSGYRWRNRLNLPEIAMAERSMDSILPTPIVTSLAQRSLVERR